MKRLVTLLLFVSPLAWAEDLAPPIEIPSVDVEANVRRMIEEAKKQKSEEEKAKQTAEEATKAPASNEAPQAGAEALSQPPTSEPPPVAAPTAQPPKGKEAKKAVTTKRPAQELDFIPLPETTITVRSVGDVDNVAKQLDEARKKKESESSPSSEKPAP